MANKLETNIDPQAVTIEDIEKYKQQTEETIDQIENIDIENLKNIYSIQTKFFQKNKPEDSESLKFLKGMAWFKIQQD